MNPTAKYAGIFPALLTPFDKQDRINEQALEKLIKLNLSKGVNGFYVGGSTAEAFLLSGEERKLVYKLVKEIAGDACTLIAHIGCISTSQAIEFGSYAAELGYDAISSVTPFYYKFTFREIKNYYFDIANAVDLAVLLYNIPTFSGVSLTVDNVREFLSDDRFIGIKHTSNDYFALEQFKTAFPDKLVYNGFDEMFLAGLSMGADGGIGSTYNFMAEKFVAMQALFRDGKLKEAQKIQKTVNQIITALIKVGVFQGEKAVLDIMGLDFGDVRAPFEKITSAQYAFVEKEIMPLL